MQTILMLDDEPNVVAALRRTLRGPLAARARIECFTDPHAALARIDEQAFDLVMSDFRMPLMDGVQFLRFVRELQPQSVRMVVSASTDMNAVMGAVNDVGVFRYVVKPWTTDLLIEDVHAALALSHSQREQQRLAEAMRAHQRLHDAAGEEQRRLEALEPGITQVAWGPQGEVLMPPLHADAR